MVNKEGEQEAREICAYTNFCNDCNQCAYTQFPTLKWISEPHFDYRECKEWEEYLVHPIDKLYRKIRCLIGLHNWFNYDKIVNKQCLILRKCTRCKVEDKYVSNEDYTKGKWVRIK